MVVVPVIREPQRGARWTGLVCTGGAGSSVDARSARPVDQVAARGCGGPRSPGRARPFGHERGVYQRRLEASNPWPPRSLLDLDGPGPSASRKAPSAATGLTPQVVADTLRVRGRGQRGVQVSVARHTRGPPLGSTGRADLASTDEFPAPPVQTRTSPSCAALRLADGPGTTTMRSKMTRTTDDAPRSQRSCRRSASSCARAASPRSEGQGARHAQELEQPAPAPGSPSRAPRRSAASASRCAR